MYRMEPMLVTRVLHATDFFVQCSFKASLPRAYFEASSYRGAIHAEPVIPALLPLLQVPLRLGFADGRQDIGEARPLPPSPRPWHAVIYAVAGGRRCIR